MIIRPARLSDFAHLETFVWQAIFPAFDVPGLSEAQRAENDALVEGAREEIAEVLGREYHAVFVAMDPKVRSLAGYIIVDARPGAYAEIKRLLVKRAFRGKGVGGLLLDEATDFIGGDRAVSLAVRHYNTRAIAFFTKHGFVNTGETTGDYLIPRMLLLREADVVNPQKSAANLKEKEPTFGADFPSVADEPVFEPLPDYTLATDETPLFKTGENALRTDDVIEPETEDTSLTEEQLSVLESFIAKARAQKGIAKPTDVPASPEQKTKPNTFDRTKIAFEVDYGEATPPVTPPKEQKPQPSFSFDFSPVREEPSDESVVAPVAREPMPQPVESREAKGPQGIAEPVAVSAAHPEGASTKSTKVCPDCETELPVQARFCYVCGLPQATTTPSRSSAPEMLDEALALPELPVEPEEVPEAKSKEEPPKKHASATASAKETTLITSSTLRKAFRSYLENRVSAYFGDRQLQKYLRRLEGDTAFQQVRDGSLGNLVNWLNGQPAGDIATVRKQNTFADLTEYFIVETAGDLSGKILPQRLLRHQSVNWQTADLFKLIMDYLDFSSETETVHTDFVTMPPRALKNATKSFLHAAKDERVFFICDQSLISQAKNGFAITDAGIYWKNVLQPAGAATFTTMSAPAVEQGHLVVDGQFFDAGGSLNIKVAVLLDKLRRMTG